MLKIGVRLPRQFEDSGDYLADARAMESAGADSLWVGDEGYDPRLLLAGVGAVTSRIRPVVPVSSAGRGGPGKLGGPPGAPSRPSPGRPAPAGATGLIVPLDPRLLDLLRNGDEEEDRSDLGLAQG